LRQLAIIEDGAMLVRGEHIEAVGRGAKSRVSSTPTVK
jgi:hypothetical protein